MEKSSLNQPKLSLLSFAILFLLAFNFFILYKFIRLYNLVDEIVRFNSQIEGTTSQSITDILRAAKVEQDKFGKNLKETSDRILEQQQNTFKSQLQALRKQIETQQAKYQREKNRLERIENGLPEQVELDDLYTKYSKRYSASEVFHTSKGSISFYSSHIEYTLVPSTGKVASIRIGKGQSTEDSELIKAWLRESEQVKQRLGYKFINQKTRPTDYGEATEKLYRRGDMYFKTYYQYTRVQGTYNSTNYRYKFYVEIGSEKRKNRHKLEQYNNKLGS